MLPVLFYLWQISIRHPYTLSFTCKLVSRYPLLQFWKIQVSKFRASLNIIEKSFWNESQISSASFTVKKFRIRYRHLRGITLLAFTHFTASSCKLIMKFLALCIFSVTYADRYLFNFYKFRSFMQSLKLAFYNKYISSSCSSMLNSKVNWTV